MNLNTASWLRRFKRKFLLFALIFVYNRPRCLLSSTVRYSFTLLEILLAITIASLIASVIGIQASNLLSHYFFKQEIETFTTTLKEAQWLAVAFETDIQIHLFEEKGTFYYLLQSDEPFTKIPLDRQKKKLAQVKKIFHGKKSEKDLILTLFSGRLEPRGTLTFVSKNKQHQFVDFQGAFAITLSSQKPSLLPESIPSFPQKKDL